MSWTVGQLVTVTFTGRIRSVFDNAVAVESTTAGGSEGYFMFAEANIEDEGE